MIRFHLPFLVTIMVAACIVSPTQGMPEQSSPVNPSPWELNSIFTSPTPSNRTFDRVLWRTAPEKRWTMLFSLGEIGLLGKPVAEVQSLLGEPDAEPRMYGVTKTSTTSLYDLGECDGEQVLLQVLYQHDRLYALTLLFSSDGSKNTSDFGWVTSNQSGDDAARILNQKYFLVGMPVGYVKQILSATPKHLAGTADHFIGPIQFQYNDDNTRVKRFRLFYRPSSSTRLVPSEWQDKNLCTTPQCYVDASIRYSCIHSRQWNNFEIDPLLLKPYMVFTPEFWRTCTRSRDDMLFDLCHTQRLIGMHRAEVHKLLGQPACNTPTLGSGSVLAPIDRESDWYCVHSPMYCGTPPSTFFQLYYENDRVKKYRIADREGGMGAPPYRFGARLYKGPELAMTIPVEEEITEVSMQPHFPPGDIAPATILDER